MTGTPTDSVHTLRLFVPSAASRKVVLDHPGILCIGAEARDGLPALLLVYDECARNCGTSATNAMEAVLEALCQAWGHWLDLSSTNVVQHDSDECYDHVVVKHGSTGALSVGWSPLNWASQKPRSAQAFLGLFGSQAKVVRRALLAYDLYL